MNYEWVDEVSVNSSVNSSGSNDGYADFTNVQFELEAGDNQISLSPGFRSGSYNEHWRVWIDFNQDEVFQANELVYSGASSSSLIGSIMVPNDALGGVTQMRVSMKYGSAASSCGSFTYGEVEDYLVSLDVVDSSSPSVISMSPIDGATEVNSNANIAITFSEDIDPLSVSLDSVSLTDQDTSIAGVVTSNGAVVTFAPNEPLTQGVVYQVAVAGVADIAGNPLVQDALWSFSTAAADTEAPVVVLTSPSNGADDVSNNLVIQVQFSEEMDPQSFDASTFIISDGLNNLSGNINVSGSTAQFYLDAPLEYSTEYSVSVASSVSDINGNALGQDLNFSFTSRAFQASYCSASGDNVSLSWVDSVRVNNFTSSFQSSGFSGYRNNTSTAFDVSRFDNLLELSPAYSGSQFSAYWTVFVDYNQDSDFASDEVAFEGAGANKITGGLSIPDSALGGYTRMRVVMNLVSAPQACGTFGYGQVVDFRVLIPEPVVDIIAPTIVSIAPADNAIDVGVSSTVTVQFSEEINAQTINAQNILLTIAGVPVENSMDYSSATNTLTLTPSVALEEGASYTVELGNGLEDIAGNSMANVFMSTFFTASQVDDNYSLSGSVSAFGSQLQGVTINVAGENSYSAISSNVGTFSFSDLPIGTYTISASKPGYTFTPASMVIELIDANISAIEFIAQTNPQNFTNGDFESGDFTGFTLYETNNGHTVTAVVTADTTPNGVDSKVAQIAPGVQGSNDIGSPGGGGFYQTIALQDGDLNVAMNIAAISNNGNGDGGVLEVFFNGVLMDSHDFGSLSPATKKYSTLSLSIPNVTAGAHELRIQSTREYLTTTVYHHIDDVVLSGSSLVD